ncbi:MAG: T9SS type A sorting domain-containing protein [bacterium]|nr:T9SS type A sorting domain-containing protein [bacterium]
MELKDSVTCVLSILVVLLSLSHMPVAAAIIYVDADATGTTTGLIWEDAFTDLQSALNAAAVDDEIWVADGIYLPSVEVEGTGNRFFSFQLKNEVALYGGFAGGETEFAARDWTLNIATLSGDIGLVGDNTDNCLHVFHHPQDFGLDASARLDGFTVTGGYADLAGGDSRKGGGMYNEDSSPTLANCTFTDNRAWSSSYARGGAIYNQDSSPTIVDCTFSGNYSYSTGGAIYSSSGSSPLIAGCLFTGNQAGEGGNGDGGAIYHSSGLMTTIVDCVFKNNWAKYNGGVIFNYGNGGGANIANCTFSDNEAGMYGGAIYNRSGTVLNCANSIFNRNAVTAGNGHGGVVYNTACDPVFTNCVFYDNESGCVGQGVYNIQFADAIFRNCILEGEWVLYNGGDCDVVVTYCCLEQAGYEAPELHNVYADPLLVDPGNDDFHLQAESPCIDAGDNEVIPVDLCDVDGDEDFDEVLPWDFEGDDRRQDDTETADSGNGNAPIVDIGADELASTVGVPNQTLAASLLALRNYPNPFNPGTTISFVLDADADVELAIFDLQGRLIRTLIAGRCREGVNEVVWRGVDDVGGRVASGIYLYRLATGDLVTSGRMVLLK